MTLEFRTKRNANGNCKYLGVDTTAKTFTRVCKTWIAKDMPELRAADLERIRAACLKDGYKEV